MPITSQADEIVKKRWKYEYLEKTMNLPSEKTCHHFLKWKNRAITYYKITDEMEFFIYENIPAKHSIIAFSLVPYHLYDPQHIIYMIVIPPKDLFMGLYTVETYKTKQVTFLNQTYTLKIITLKDFTAHILNGNLELLQTFRNTSRPYYYVRSIREAMDTIIWNCFSKNTFQIILNRIDEALYILYDEMDIPHEKLCQRYAHLIHHLYIVSTIFRSRIISMPSKIESNIKNKTIYFLVTTGKADPQDIILIESFARNQLNLLNKKISFLDHISKESDIPLMSATVHYIYENFAKTY